MNRTIADRREAFRFAQSEANILKTDLAVSVFRDPADNGVKYCIHYADAELVLAHNGGIRIRPKR